MVQEETDTETASDTDTEPNTAPIRVTEEPRDMPPDMATNTEPSLGVCPHCGAKVVPQEIKTPSGGKTYRCPKCGKFGKFITPDQVKVREEEARGPLPPLEVLVTERVKELLVKELPRVYGIPKKDATKTITAILDTLTSASIMDPWNLHSHIKDFAPNANDRHLESIIEKIFDQLQEEGYLPRDQGYQPRYGRRRERRREYRPRYAPRERRPRPRRHDYEDEDYEYEDYEPSSYIAHQTFRRELAEERRREEEHELRMKRLESEILKITRETGGVKTEPHTDKAEERRKEEEHELRMKRLESEILKITRETEGVKTEPHTDKAEERRKQEEHELKMKRLEADILKITRETGGPRTPQGSYEEVREFIDDKGNLCDPEKAVSVRIKRMPTETKAGLTAEAVRKIIREEKEVLTPEKVRDIIRGEIGGKGELSEEKIRSIIKEETMREPLTAQGVEEIVRKITAEEKEKLTPEKVREIVKSELRVPPPGTMTAEGVLATAIQEAGRAVGHREPVKVIIEGARDILTPPGVSSTIPPSEMAGQAEREGVIQELRKHGLVTKIVERVRG